MTHGRLHGRFLCYERTAQVLRPCRRKVRQRRKDNRAPNNGRTRIARHVCACARVRASGLHGCGVARRREELLTEARQRDGTLEDTMSAVSKADKTTTADMVKDAIKTLGERGGSSLHNIKKYIEAVYQVDMRYRSPRIRKFLRAAVSDGGLVQTRGRGASGSFKLPPADHGASTSSEAKIKTSASTTSSTSTSSSASKPSGKSETAERTASRSRR